MNKFKLIALLVISFALLFQSCTKEEDTAPDTETTCEATDIADDIIGTWTSDSWSGSVTFDSPTTSGTRAFEDPQHFMGKISGAALTYDDKFYFTTSSSITIEHRKCWSCTSDAKQWKYTIIEYDCNRMVIESQRPGLPNTRYTLTK
ncbi:MAG: hypothetical protein ACRBFS_02790 [Aureispira sp.]